MTFAPSTKPPLSWHIILFMAAIHGLALLAFLPSNFRWSAVAIALIFHTITAGVGVTLGFHRLVAHRSFQVPKWLEYLLVFCGSLACQGGPIEWIGLHRHHHAYSDQDNDHHDSTKGFWWSHMEWMFYQVEAKKHLPRFTKDICDDPVYLFLENYFILVQVALGFVFLALGGWPLVIWGIFVRLAVVYHCTWFVNSATHKFGYRTYESGDRSTNCWWVAILSYGEGWHNNHHAFQYSARHGLKWWEIDMTWMAIQFLKLIGLATNVKLPDSKALTKRQLVPNS